MTDSLEIKLSDSLLPLTTVYTVGDYSQQNPISTMFDIGAQSSFILSSLADKLHLPTVQDHIPLILKGFTGEERYKTRTVRMTFVLNSKNVFLTCLCVPQIKIQFAIPYLNDLLISLNKNNVELAFLPFYEPNLNSVQNISLLIGAKDWDLIFSLPRKLIGNKKGKQSAFYLSDDKIIPIGSIELFLSNYEYEARIIDNSWHSKPNMDVSLAVIQSKIECKSSMDDSINCMVSESPPRDIFIENIESPVMYNYNSFTSQNVMLDSIPDSLLINSLATIAELEDDLDSIDLATHIELNRKYGELLNINQSTPEDEEIISQSEITNFILSESYQDSENRHIMAIPWISRFKNRLKSNEGLAKQVLKSILKKYSKQPDLLLKTDEVFKKQLGTNIIELVPNLDEYKQDYPNYSFLSHFPLFKDDRLTTKVRIIYMANLAEKNKDGSIGLSINNAIHPGFCYNSKIATAFCFNRFDKYLLCYDISKAFHQMGITLENSSKFLFYWFRNISQGDYTKVVYRFCRVPFGVSCSPYLLVCCLFKFLIQNRSLKSLSDEDNEKQMALRTRIFHGSYVDNVSLGCNSLSELKYAHDESVSIFKDNQFPLQQFVCNHIEYQHELDKIHEETATENVKVLGMIWNRLNDTFQAPSYSMELNVKSKRDVLREINRNFDLMGTNIPLLNRAKLFLRELQGDSKLTWDTSLNENRLQEWRNIVRQFNEYESVVVSRSMGDRTDSYELCVFCDASKDFIGCVLYMKNLNNGQISFLLAKNQLLDRIQRSRSTPVLEFTALEFAVRKTLSLYEELTTALVPVKIKNIRLFSDSTIALGWLSKSENLLDKMNKRSVYINNRINNIVHLCSKIHCIFCTHVGTEFNSADYVTRKLSPKRLAKTNFISGPILIKSNLNSLIWVEVPNPNVDNDPTLPRFSVNEVIVTEERSHSVSDLINLNKFSSFNRAIRTLVLVRRFCNRLKAKLLMNDPVKYSHLSVDSTIEKYARCERDLILEDQEKEFPEVFEYFRSKHRLKIPPLIAQLNLVIDNEDLLLKVKSKMGKLLSSKVYKFPLLLSKSSHLMKALVWDLHFKFNHSGLYYILNQLRRKYFILRAFSSVKKILLTCSHCRRFNSRPIKVNTNDYRSFMVNPKQQIFATTYIDYAGPYMTRIGDVKQKTYVVLFKCFWSKTINIQLTHSADAKGFLLAFQNQIYEYGIPQIVHSDAGTNFAAGFSWLRDVVDTVEVKDYFDQLGIRTPTFDQLPRGSLNRGLPGFIESSIKIVKRLIQGAIRNNVLEFEQFSSLMKQCVCYSNKRPITCLAGLRDQNVNNSFNVLTPEILKFGYETCVLEVNVPQHDLDTWVDKDLIDPRIAYANVNELLKVKDRIRDGYYSEFLYALIDDATRIRDKYLPIKHQILSVGDIVLIRDPYVKSSAYPMAVVTCITKNSLQEVTKAVVMKANGSKLSRDVSDLILLIKARTSENDKSLGCNELEFQDNSSTALVQNLHDSINFSTDVRQRRLAAIKCDKALRKYYS